jgi:hypothetical protein
MGAITMRFFNRIVPMSIGVNKFENCIAFGLRLAGGSTSNQALKARVRRGRLRVQV